WYDHVLAPILTQSQTGLDGLTGAGLCGSNPARVPAGQQGRCGLGPRLPLLVISPFAKKNYVDHSVTDQSSIIHFVEDNWKLGGIGSGSVDQSSGSLNGMFNFNDREGGGDDSRLFLNPQTGQKKS
ncbi:MAG TPA: alkaline phosphatase family protein, partial [Candidatus Dormibacteraeota bacterium]|nr:alkaline phosphatase family protein [Candidatus Dormibacteraeota bacterium]